MEPKRWPRRLAIAMALLAWAIGPGAGSAAAAASGYKLSTIAAASGGSCSPTAINAAGAVAGVYYGGALKAFYARKGKVQILSHATVGAFGHALNKSGVVVGAVDGADGASVSAVMWKQGAESTLPGLGGDWATAWGINDAGQIVGSAENPKPTDPNLDPTLAVLWDGGKIVALETLLPTGEGWIAEGAWAINGKGQIAVNGFNQNQGGYYGGVLTPAAG